MKTNLGHSYFYFCFSSHFSEKSYAPNRKKNKSPPPPTRKKSQYPHTASGHRHAEVQTFVFLAGIIHISVTVQAPSQSPTSGAVRCASASALECENAPPSQSILGTQDVQTGTSMKPLPQQGGDWHCHTWSKRAVSLACWQSRLLLACTIMFGSDRTSLLNSSGRFFFFFEFLPKATRAGDEKQRNKKQWPYWWQALWWRRWWLFQCCCTRCSDNRQNGWKPRSECRNPLTRDYHHSLELHSESSWLL